MNNVFLLNSWFANYFTGFLLLFVNCYPKKRKKSLESYTVLALTNMIDSTTCYIKYSKENLKLICIYQNAITMHLRRWGLHIQPKRSEKKTQNYYSFMQMSCKYKMSRSTLWYNLKIDMFDYFYSLWIYTWTNWSKKKTF